MMAIEGDTWMSNWLFNKDVITRAMGDSYTPSSEMPSPKRSATVEIPKAQHNDMNPRLNKKTLGICCSPS